MAAARVLERSEAVVVEDAGSRYHRVERTSCRSARGRGASSREALAERARLLRGSRRRGILSLTATFGHARPYLARTITKFGEACLR